jgi:hypothetical protein
MVANLSGTKCKKSYQIKQNTELVTNRIEELRSSYRKSSATKKAATPRLKQGLYDFTAYAQKILKPKPLSKTHLPRKIYALRPITN